MKKKLKLKENVKNTLLFITVLFVAVALTQLYIKRIEQINSPDFVNISDSEMDK